MAVWPCTGHFIFLGLILLISFLWAVPLTCRKMAVLQGCRFHCWLAHTVKRFLCNLCPCLPPLIVHSLLLIVPSGKTQISFVLFTHLKTAVKFLLNLSWWYVWGLFLPCCFSQQITLKHILTLSKQDMVNKYKLNEWMNRAGYNDM